MKTIAVQLSVLILFVLLTQCKSTLNKTEITYIPPSYDSLKFTPSSDTIQFILAPGATTSINNCNYFSNKGSEYISFYDKIFKSVSIYKFPSAELVSVLPLKKWITEINLDKSSLYIKNFDSILLCTRSKIILMDSSSLVKKTIDIPPSPIRVPKIDNETPPVFKNDTLYVNIVPSIDETSLSAHRSWRLLFGLNLKNNEQTVLYHLPKLYSQNIYGYPFLEYSYCMNDKGKFVFSFPADTNVYETDLAGFNKGYFAKSQFQFSPIAPITKEAIKNDKSFEEYSLRDSYGAIFFDPVNKRYFRMAKQKMKQDALRARERIRVRSIIIMDEAFKVIGEGFFPVNCEFNSVFFSRDGSMYARYLGQQDNRLRLVKIQYSINTDQIQIARKH